MYDPAGAKRLIAALSASPRFRNVRIFGYTMQLDHITQMQFSAMSFKFAKDQTYIAFRGTDNTIVGWKENLNMAFQVRVPSQEQALRYVERVGARVGGKLWLGGHSKGGNLALYVGHTCSPELYARLECCYSHDGPAFTPTMLAELDTEGRDLTFDKTVPKSSVFGMLFDHGEQDVDVVRSASSGFAQHDPLSWEVDGCDFVIVDRLGRTATYVDSSLNAWIDRASLEERQRFVEAVFNIMTANDAQYTHEITLNWRTSIPTMARAAIDLDPKERDVLVHQVLELMRELVPGGE
jgi:hypothetical protein